MLKILIFFNKKNHLFPSEQKSRKIKSNSNQTKSNQIKSNQTKVKSTSCFLTFKF